MSIINILEFYKNIQLFGTNTELDEYNLNSFYWGGSIRHGTI